MSYLPHRGDLVEAWIKEKRDEYKTPRGITPEWTALDNLLDDYRLAADTGEVWEGEAEHHPNWRITPEGHIWSRWFTLDRTHKYRTCMHPDCSEKETMEVKA